MQPSPSDGSGGMLLFALREGALCVAHIFPGYNIWRYTTQVFLRQSFRLRYRLRHGKSAFFSKNLRN